LLIYIYIYLYYITYYILHIHITYYIYTQLQGIGVLGRALPVHSSEWVRSGVNR